MDVHAEAILESLGPARKFADPSAPKDARLMAARGALPLPPPQICSVLFALTLDDDPEVKARIEAMLGFMENLTCWYEQVKRLPNPTLVALMKMGAKVARFVGK